MTKAGDFLPLHRQYYPEVCFIRNHPLVRLIRLFQRVRLRFRSNIRQGTEVERRLTVFGGAAGQQGDLMAG